MNLQNYLLQYGAQARPKMIPNFVSETVSEKTKKALQKLKEAQQSDKEFIYASEEFIRWRNLRYDVYLECGNMKDICEMKPWDLIGISKRSQERKPRKSGEYKISRRTKYHDDVIKRGREERKKARDIESKLTTTKKAWKETSGFSR